MYELQLIDQMFNLWIYSHKICLFELLTVLIVTRPWRAYVHLCINKRLFIELPTVVPTKQTARTKQRLMYGFSVHVIGLNLTWCIGLKLAILCEI